MIADIVSITPAPLGIQIKTSYRTSMRTLEHSDTRFLFEIRQLPSDSDANKDIRHFSAQRFVQEVIIDGKKYVYIRVLSRNEVNGSVLPNAKNTFERNAGPANEELLLLIIDAAKGR